MTTPDPAPPAASLASAMRGHLAAWAAGLGLRARRGIGWARARAGDLRIGWHGDWRVAAGIAALIAAGPLASWIGALVLAEGLRGEIARLEPLAAPRMARAQAATAARAALSDTVRRVPMAIAVEAVARGLPEDSSLIGAARDGDGTVRIEVATPDPDGLRGALRRSPALAGLRDAGQRRGGTGMVVTLEGRIE